MTNTEETTILAIIGDLVHSLQTERGICCICLYGDRDNFQLRLKAQKHKTDQRFDLLADNLANWKETKRLSEAHITRLLQLLNERPKLNAIREEVSNAQVDVPQVIEFYSMKLIGIYLQTMVEIALFDAGNDLSYVSAYSAFLNWKERIGLERAIGARRFVEGAIFNDDFLERVSFLLEEQRSFKNTFFALANPRQEALLEKALNIPAVKELHKYHKIFQHSPNSDMLSDLTTEYWFDLLSAKVDALHSVAGQMETTLRSAEVEELEVLEANPNADMELSFYLPLLNSLNLFMGISSSSIDSLLMRSQVRQFKRGQLIFNEGEWGNRIYIVLHGWIKLFKHNSDGQECVLQMLSSGETIVETVLLKNRFIFSAQAVSDVTILSIPAVLFRKTLRKNTELAINTIATISDRSRVLIRQIESNRLKSADERIRWFLLHLYIEQGFSGLTINLPFDKSLIATYLDMTPETLSRAFKRLKKIGFSADKEMVTMPEAHALCGYCDDDTQQRCAFADTNDCPCGRIAVNF